MITTVNWRWKELGNLSFKSVKDYASKRLYFSLIPSPIIILKNVSLIKNCLVFIYFLPKLISIPRTIEAFVGNIIFFFFSSWNILLLCLYSNFSKFKSLLSLLLDFLYVFWQRQWRKHWVKIINHKHLSQRSLSLHLFDQRMLVWNINNNSLFNCFLYIHHSCFLLKKFPESQKNSQTLFFHKNDSFILL